MCSTMPLYVYYNYTSIDRPLIVAVLVVDLRADVGLGDVPIRSNVSQRVGDATAGAKRDIPLG